MIARGVEAGPDESFERLRWVIISALNAARRSVRIVRNTQRLRLIRNTLPIKRKPSLSSMFEV